MLINTLIVKTIIMSMSVFTLKYNLTKSKVNLNKVIVNN